MYKTSFLLILLVILKTGIARKTGELDQSIVEASRHGLRKFCRIFNTVDNGSLPQNTFYSPFSLQLMLTMLSFGTSGASRKQITKTVLPTNNEIQIKNWLKNIIEELKYNSANKLDIATEIFVQDNLQVKANFNHILKTFFYTGVRSVDFGNKKQAIQDINKWIRDKTNRKIEKCVKDISEDTKMVLINALTFEAKWMYPFITERTTRRKFQNINGEFKTTSFMERKGYYKCNRNEHLKSTVVEIPYKDFEYSMFVVLPDNLTGLKEVENKFQKDSYVKYLPTTLVPLQIRFPKFKFSSDFDLVKGLQKIGVKDIFNRNEANFKELTDEPVFVKQFVQRTDLQVNEIGTEVSAATLVSFHSRYLPNPDLLDINRPFLVFIQNNHLGLPLFFGRVTKL